MAAAKKSVVNLSKKQGVEDTEVARVNVLVPVDVAQWLNIYAAKNNMTLALAVSDVVRSVSQHTMDLQAD